MPLRQFQARESVKYTIAIAAGKGGVGKSSIAVNLALSLKKLGYKVGLMDTDLYGPSVRKMLPEESPPEQIGEIIKPAICQGIKMISMAYFRKENEAAVVRAPIANGIIAQFIKQVDWGGLDFLLIDFPPGTGDIQLTIAQQANLTGAIMVTTPQEVAMMDVRKAIDMFRQVQVGILGVVENMSYYFHEKSGDFVYIFGKGGGDKLSRESCVPLLGQIPIDPQLCASADIGKHDFGKDTNEAIDHFARAVVDRVEKMEKVPVIEKIFQKDPRTLCVVWADGKNSEYLYSDLQKKCPCASCVDRGSAEGNVEVENITQVGKYALKFKFSTGCSTGIYSFEMLRKLNV